MSSTITQKGVMKKQADKTEHFHAYIPCHLTKKLRDEAEKNSRKISAQLKIILEDRYQLAE